MDSKIEVGQTWTNFKKNSLKHKPTIKSQPTYTIAPHRYSNQVNVVEKVLKEINQLRFQEEQALAET